jgi:hypothetical protein
MADFGFSVSILAVQPANASTFNFINIALGLHFQPTHGCPVKPDL